MSNVDTRIVFALIMGVFLGVGFLLAYLKKTNKITKEQESDFVGKASGVISAFQILLPFIVPEVKSAEIFNKVISYVNVALSYLNEDSKEATNSIDNAIAHAKEVAEKDGINLTDEQYQAIKSTLEIFMANPKVISEVVNQPVPQKEVSVVAPVENTVNADNTTTETNVETPQTPAQ